MGTLIAIIIHLAIWGTPFLVGWNIIKKKRPRDVGDLVAAIVLLLIYLGISSFWIVSINEDLPPYAVTNEGFMFHAEKTYGIEKFYNLAQKNLQAYQKKAGYVNERPQWRYFSYYQFTDEQSMLFYFYRMRDDRLPLSVEIKLPEKEHFSNVQERNEAKQNGLSFWNKNMRIGINEDHWNRNFKILLGAARESFAVLLCLFGSVCWIFPLAATACKAHSKWLFYGLWVVVPALYIMNIHTWSQQTPALQYERCNLQTALSEISKPENQPTLSKLLQHPTAVLENDRKQTIIDVPLLCSGKFFTANFLCWDLGKSNYLYYSPTDLVEARLLTKYAKIHRPRENFYLVSYPDFTRASNNIWYRFAAIQTIAGLLWLGMFVMAIKKRCCWEEVEMTAASEINKIIVRQLQRHKLEYEIDLDPVQDNQEVVFCYDENLGQQRIFKECSEEELTLLFSALIENKALYWDIALEIAKLLPEKGHLVEDKFSIDDCVANPFYGFNQLLLAALGSDQKYESEIIKLLDAVPVDARDGLFMACEALNTPAVFCKLMEKFKLWIKADPDYGNDGTGEGGYLENFIALWQKTQDRKSLDDFIAFCRKNWCGWEEK